MVMHPLLGFFLSLLLTAPSLAQAPTPYHLLSKTHLPGDSYWDYLTVDAQARRLYITHDDRIHVLDADTKKRVGTIANTSGAHGVAIATRQHRGFITNGTTNRVMMFDAQTLKTLGTVPAGKNPDALLYDSFSGRVFVFNNDSRDITVLDASSGKVLKTFGIGGNPEAGVSDEQGRIFVNVENTSEIVVFDAKALTVLHRWPLTPGQQPTGLAYDAVNHRLFSACYKSRTMMVLDSQSGQVIAKLPIGDGADGAAYDSQTKRAFTANGEGTLTVIQTTSPKTYRVLANTRTQAGARTLALDAKTGHVYTVTAQYGPTPAKTATNPNPWPTIRPNTFVLLEVGQ